MRQYFLTFTNQARQVIDAASKLTPRLREKKKQNCDENPRNQRIHAK